MAYRLAPQRITHSWVELEWGGRWIQLEGFILDAPYLASLQMHFPQARSSYGFGAATPDLANLAVVWQSQLLDFFSCAAFLSSSC